MTPRGPDQVSKYDVSWELESVAKACNDIFEEIFKILHYLLVTKE